jgi:hypothetical protein
MIMTIKEKLIKELNKDKIICLEKASGVVEAIKSFRNVGGKLSNLKFGVQSYQVLLTIFADLITEHNITLNTDTFEELIENYSDVTGADYDSFDYSGLHPNLQGLKNQIDVQRRKILTNNLQTGLIDTRNIAKFSR